MLLIYLWIYSLFLLALWIFFIIAKIHLYKFKKFSNNIKKVTIVLAITLMFLSILWYILIFSMWIPSSQTKINNTIEVNENYY